MKQVLFVCVHNAGRSQMAEAFVNHFAKELNKPVRASSAGTVGGKAINPMAMQAMAELGIDMSKQTPKLIHQELVDTADQVITMGCGVDAEACPARFLVTTDWGLDDPAGQDLEAVRAIRNQIRARVMDLLQEF